MGHNRNQICRTFANNVDPGKLVSNSSGSVLFVIKYMYVNLYQQPGSSDLIG